VGDQQHHPATRIPPAQTHRRLSAAGRSSYL
jgi:hypothetical protein